MQFNNIRFFSSDLPDHEVLGLPALSPTMEMGNIAEWFKAEGDFVGAGDAICSIETDKATLDFVATDDGYIGKILVQGGATDIPIGKPIVVMCEEEEDIGAFANFVGEESAAAAAAPAPAAAAPAPAAAAPAPAAAAPAPAAAPVAAGERVFASPLARKIARESGIEISLVAGTGPNGRITKADVDGYTPSAASAAPAVAADAGAAFAPSYSGAFTDLPLSEQQIANAAAMTQSKATIPHYYLTVDMNLDNLLEVRESLNAGLAEEDALSVNDFVVKAASLAMRKVPECNSAWMGSFTRQFASVDTAISVASADGVVAPVLRSTDTTGLFAISQASAELQARAASGGLAAGDLDGGIFTITNVGSYGVKTGSAVIAPAQSSHLTVGAIETRIVPNDDAESDQIYKEAVMVTSTLSCDHRVIDGAVGAQWLAEFKGMIENPMKMLL